MNEKIQAIVRRITTDEATFKESKAIIDPTAINFFFGTNGTGKSTIARAFKSQRCIDLAHNKDFDSIDILVYDKDFIELNVQNYQGLPGVYTLNRKNADIQKQIDEGESRCVELRKTIDEKTAAKQTLLDEQSSTTNLFQKACWEKKNEYDKKFSKALQGIKLSKKKFSDAIANTSPSETDMDALQALYDSVFADDTRRYSLFVEVPNAEILDNLEGADLLEKPIVNSADTDLARFFQSVGSTNWARQGHDSFSKVAEGHCPYCSRELPPDFEKSFIASFDQTYQLNLQNLQAYLQSYRDIANQSIAPIGHPPAEVMPQIHLHPYTEQYQLLSTTIRSNISEIESKIANPGSIAHITPTAPIIQELKSIVAGYNKAINTNNEAVDQKGVKQEECKKLLVSHIAFELEDSTRTFNQSMKTTSGSIGDLDAAIVESNAEIARIDSELRNLRKQTVETETAKDSINKMLRDSGMQGFYLVSKQDAPNVYEITRPDGTIATNLSEGERNFIAFLYFYHLVQGTNNADGVSNQKVIVIDDPVSSMDDKSLFIVSALTRQMIEICRNAADGSSPIASGSFIKQIFVFTHNAYFHREITYSYVDKYRYVSFYLIRKVNSKSSVMLCDEMNPRIPTERINRNPVKNSYAALWEEYKHLDSPIALMNVIRRILEYYFLQLCGYEGITLRQAVLINNKDKFKDEEQFQLASAMFAYIKASSIGMNDGFDYVEEGMSIDDCRFVFKMIFECMNQNQHYEMMMNERLGD